MKSHEEKPTCTSPRSSIEGGQENAHTEAAEGESSAAGGGEEKKVAQRKYKINTHGESDRKRGTRTVEYSTWSGMITRCENPRSKDYSRYGARGIKVCERWRNCYDNFLKDMGRKPGKSYSLDRINNDGNYEPGNCRWASKKEQSNNQRTNVKLVHNGQTATVAEWAELTGLRHDTIGFRLRTGWSVSRTLTTPARKHHRK